jgi:hypothetical protein
MDEEADPAFGGGAELSWDKNSQFRLEGFYTQKTLPPRKAQSWFSASPPLPERDFRFYAMGTVFSVPAFGLASDWAFSETFAYGRDMYGNAALRFGNRPWRLSLAADGAGNRFVGRDGAIVKEGFRLGGRLERLGTRSGLYRLSGEFRGSTDPRRGFPSAWGWGETFEQGLVSLYLRPSTRPLKKSALPWGFSRASLSLDRDGRIREKTEDTVKGTINFNLGPVRTGFSGAYTALTAFTEERPPPLPLPPAFGDFSSAKIAGEISWSPGIFQFRAKLGYTAKKDKESLWDTSFYGAAKIGKQGRWSFKIAAPDFPREWNYTISWRLNSSH